MAPRCLIVLVAIGAVLVPAISDAQVVGSITGTVTDQTGMPLRGVRIDRPIRHPDRRRQGRRTPTSEGFFRVPGLQPGVFEVTASAPGPEVGGAEADPRGHERARRGQRDDGGGDPRSRR